MDLKDKALVIPHLTIESWAINIVRGRNTWVEGAWARRKNTGFVLDSLNSNSSPAICWKSLGTLNSFIGLLFLQSGIRTPHLRISLGLAEESALSFARALLALFAQSQQLLQARWQHIVLFGSCLATPLFLFSGIRSWSSGKCPDYHHLPMQSTGMTPADIAGKDVLKYRAQHFPGHFAVPSEWEDFWEQNLSPLLQHKFTKSHIHIFYTLE